MVLIRALVRLLPRLVRARVCELTRRLTVQKRQVLSQSYKDQPEEGFWCDQKEPECFGLRMSEEQTVSLVDVLEEDEELEEEASAVLGGSDSDHCSYPQVGCVPPQTWNI